MSKVFMGDCYTMRDDDRDLEWLRLTINTMALERRHRIYAAAELLRDMLNADDTGEMELAFTLVFVELKQALRQVTQA